MKKKLTTTQIILSILLFALANNLWAASSSLSEKQKLGYALGMDIGASLKRLNPPIELPMLLKGINDFYNGEKDLMLTPDEAYRIKKSYASSHEKNAPPTPASKNKLKNIKQWRKKTAQKNMIKNRRFFSQNRRTIGVKETKSGMQYMVVKKGSGKVPDANSIVSVKYKAMTLDGTIFDDSSKRATPAMFLVREALKGWQEALLMMNVGSSYRIFLPPKLSYGNSGSGTFVEPGAGLIFEIELLDIISPAEYQKSEAKRHKIPPYTSPGQYNILLPKLLPKQSVVQNNDIDLKTLKAAGKTFMTLRNNIMPVYSLENIQEICKTVSDKDFLSGCISSLMDRVNWLKGLTGLKGANFPSGSINLPPKEKNALDIRWQEVLLFDNQASQSNDYHLRVHYKKVNKEWRINKIDEL